MRRVWPSCEPAGVKDVHETVRSLSSSQLVIVVGALAAALAGLDVGAQTRPVTPLAGHTLGPRTDFDAAAHPPAPAAPPPRGIRIPTAAGGL
jgi:hypothetical protein